MVRPKLNPGQRHMEKRIAVMRAILRAQYIDVTTASILLDVGYGTAWETLNGMRRDKLVSITTGHLIAGRLFLATPAGVSLARENAGPFDDKLRAYTSVADAGVHYAAHNLLVQRYVYQELRKFGRGAYAVFPDQIRAYGLALGFSTVERAAWKVPDAIIVAPIDPDEHELYGRSEFRIAVEIQQSSESPDARGYKLWQLKTALDCGQITGFRYVSTRPHILESYEVQWRTNLMPYNYIVERHRWRKPKGAKPVSLDPEMQDCGVFRVVPQTLAAGLYLPEYLSGDDDRARNRVRAAIADLVTTPLGDRSDDASKPIDPHGPDYVSDDLLIDEDPDDTVRDELDDTEHSEPEYDDELPEWPD